MTASEPVSEESQRSFRGTSEGSQRHPQRMPLRMVALIREQMPALPSPE